MVYLGRTRPCDALRNCSSCAASAEASLVELKSGQGFPTSLRQIVIHTMAEGQACTRKITGGDAWVAEFRGDSASSLWRSVGEDRGDGTYLLPLPPGLFDTDDVKPWPQT